jgi:esterase
MMMQRHPPPTTFSSSTTRRALSTTESPAIQSTLYNHDDIVQLSYSEFQPSSSKGASHPPVILLHGLLGNKRNFASLASSLSTQLQNPRSIYTVDLRNHGENTHDWRDTMSYSDMARDVLAFIDKISSEKAVIVGHSMGGKVAQSLALMAPQRVAGLVVLDIAPVRYYSNNKKGGTGDDTGWKVVEQIVRSVAQIDLEEGGYKTKREVDAVLRDGILEDPALRAFVLTNLEQLRVKDNTEEEKQSQSLLKWKIHWDGIVNELDRIAGFDVHDQSMDDEDLEALDDDKQPQSSLSQYSYDGDVFFIHGGASRFVRSSHLSTITSYFPNHMLTTIRGVGHWVHAEAPDDTIALLKRYLDR